MLDEAYLKLLEMKNKLRKHWQNHYNPQKHLFQSGCLKPENHFEGVGKMVVNP